MGGYATSEFSHRAKRKLKTEGDESRVFVHCSICSLIHWRSAFAHSPIRTFAHFHRPSPSRCRESLRRRLDLPHHAQDVAAANLLDVVVGIAAADQFGDQIWIRGDVFEPADDARDAVEVAAEADVVDSGD